MKKLLKSAALAGILVATGMAQTDPPDRVARLNFTSGAVSMLTQSTGPDWTPAQTNYPLTTDDQIWTDADGRAELHVGSTAIRLHQETSATFTALDDQAVQLQLIAGGLNIHVGNLYNQEIFEVDTPNLAFTIRQPGDYRVDVYGQQTRVLVWSGAADISGRDNRTIPLHARDYAEVSGDGQLSYNLMSVPAPDDFDRWSQDRDRRQEQQSAWVRSLPEGTIGAEDLDLYGTWSEVPHLGGVWTPRVDPGWSPYRTGHWAWIEPWGWTWIDDSPWGFAPYHYGRWTYATGVWVWVPGPRGQQRAVYSPALVGWYGGDVTAWFPLGPGEAYVPAHHVSPGYVNRVNAGNKTAMNHGPYVNQNVPGAVVGMSRGDMAAGRRTSVALPPSAVRTAQATAVAPVPASRPVFQSNVQAARPPVEAASPNRAVVRRHEPPTATAAVAPVAAQAPVQAPAPIRRFEGPGRESETVRPARPAVAAQQAQAPVAAYPPTAPSPRVPERAVERPVATPQLPQQATRPDVRLDPRPAAPKVEPTRPIEAASEHAPVAITPQAPRPPVRPEVKRDDHKPEPKKEEKKDEKKQ